MQSNWTDLIKPTALDVTPGDEPLRQATVVAEPLERGFGRTLGNALRRVLLSSLRGAAVTAIQIDGVLHEFSSIAGVREDVTDIILNVKALALKLHADGAKKFRLRGQGPGEITAGMIDGGADLEIMNPDLVICTLDDGAVLSMEITVDHGKGYRPAAANRPEDAPIGLIPVDSLFSPINTVSYQVENTRVGQRTDYDKLNLEIWTDGRLEPHDALLQASAILRHHLDVFVNYDDDAILIEDRPETQSEENAELKKLLNMSVNEIELSVRAANCLNNANITTVGQLALKTEAEMLKYRNFGKKSLNEIKDKLTQLGLSLGMNVDSALLDGSVEES